MVTIKQLPYEICHQILQFASKKDVFECMTLCKTWHQAATEAFYKEITIQQSDILYLTSKFDLKPQDKGYQNLESGRWVLALKILDEDDNMDIFGQDGFKQLLSFLPSLENLDLSGSFHCDYYFSILQEIDSSIYLRKIKKIVPFTALDDSSIITTEDLKIKQQLEFSAIHNFCNTITTLHLHCYPDTLSSNELSLLSEFKNLTYLDIRSPHAAGVALFDLLNYCQNLKRFTVFRLDSVAVPGFDNLSFGKIQRQFSRKWNNMVTDKSEKSSTTAANHNECLEYLNLYIPSLPPPYLVYLSNYLPSTLKYLGLSLTGTNLAEWIEENSFDVIAAFARRLSLIPKVTLISQKVRDSSLEKMIESEKMVMVHMLLCVLKKKGKAEGEEEREMRCMADYSFGYMEDDGSKQEESMLISIENGSIRFAYKQLSSRPLPLSTTRISSKNDSSRSIDCLSIDLENLTPSTTIIEELLKYALVNYPYVDSILVHFHDVVNSSDMCFHAFEEDNETNNKDTAVARLSAASNNDTTPDDGNGGYFKRVISIQRPGVGGN